MLHRVTWYSAGILALVAIASTAGYWGFGQMKERSALVQSADVAYTSSFEDLVSNVTNMKEEMANSLVTSNQTTFDSHLAGISRFAYAAETDLSKLPNNAQSMSQLHGYLNGIDTSTRKWLGQPNSASDRNIRKSLSGDYLDSQKIETKLSDIQSQISAGNHEWMTRNHASSGTPAALVAMQKVNKTIPTSVSQSASAQVQANTSAPMKASRAVDLVKRVAQPTEVDSWTSKIANSPNSGSVFEVWGKKGQTSDLVNGVVSRQDGRLLSFHNTRSMGNVHLDITEAAKKAQAWLRDNGYPNAIETDSSQYDGKVIFTFEPVYHGSSVIDHPLHVYVALDNGQIVGFNGREAALHPVAHVLHSKLTINQLRSRLSNDFHIKMEKPVLAQAGNSQTFAPAEAFYGTMKDETFCVYLSAVDGHEIRVQHLT